MGAGVRRPVEELGLNQKMFCAAGSSRKDHGISYRIGLTW